MDRGPEVLFAVFQTGTRSNGGLESVSQIIERFGPAAVAVATQREGPFTEHWRKVVAGPVWVWPLESRPANGRLGPVVRKMLGVLKYNARVWGTLARYPSIGLVHCNDPLAFWHTAPAARLRGLRVLLNLRDTQAPGASYEKWKLARVIASRILVLSHDMKEIIERETSGNGRLLSSLVAPVEFIYSAVDGSRFHPIGREETLTLRRRRGIARDELAVLYAATFNEKKAQLALLHALDRCKNQLPSRFHLHFVGDFHPQHDPYARACLELVQRNGLAPMVTFHGHQERIEEWYQSVDVICLASQREGLARAMIEGIACGTPVVSFAVCSAREILEKHNCGRVVEQGNYDALFRELGSLLKDASCRRSLGRNGARVAPELFEPQRILHQYRNLHADMLNPRRKRTPASWTYAVAQTARWKVASYNFRNSNRR